MFQRALQCSTCRRKLDGLPMELVASHHTNRISHLENSRQYPLFLLGGLLLVGLPYSICSRPPTMHQSRFLFRVSNFAPHHPPPQLPIDYIAPPWSLATMSNPPPPENLPDASRPSLAADSTTSAATSDPQLAQHI